MKQVKTKYYKNGEKYEGEYGIMIILYLASPSVHQIYYNLTVLEYARSLKILHLEAPCL